MHLIKLLLFTLVVCLCSFLSAQSPSHLTQYTWNADMDSWHEYVREVYTDAAPQQKVVLTQYWENNSWRDWTRTTAHFNEMDQAVYSLTERMADGQFIPVIKKEFSFDETGRLLSQIDQYWSTHAQIWENVYKETRRYAPPFGETASILNERVIYKPDVSKRGWEADEKYDCFQLVVDDGVQEFSRRFVYEGGSLVVKDQLVTRTTAVGKEEILMTGRVGNWTPVSKKTTISDDFESSTSFFVYDLITKTWEKTAFEDTYFNEIGKVRNIKQEELITTFSYDSEGRVKEILRKKPLAVQFVPQTRSCGGVQHQPQEVQDANVSKEVYAYADQFELSHVPATFDMVLSPNPMKQEVEVKISEWIAGSCEIRIMDMKGRTIQKQSFASASNLKIHRDDIPAGTYILQLISSQGVKTARLMIID